MVETGGAMVLQNCEEPNASVAMIRLIYLGKRGDQELGGDQSLDRRHDLKRFIGEGTTFAKPGVPLLYFPGSLPWPPQHMYEGNVMLQCPASPPVCSHCCLTPSTSRVKMSTVPTCHVPPQDATEAQKRRQLLLRVGSTGLSPSHGHCFGVPDSVRSPLPMPGCQTAFNSTRYRQQTRCCDTVGRNPTLVTSGQRYLSEEAACDASHPLVLSESGIWVTCACCAMLARHDAL